MAAVAKKPWVGREVFIISSYVLEVNIGFTVVTEPRAGGEVNSARSLKNCTGMQRMYKTLPQSLQGLHVALGHNYITVSDKASVNWFSVTYSALVRELST